MATSRMAQVVSEVGRLFKQLDQMSYYEVLALDPKCDYIAVRDAFYDRAQRFHPDRFLAIDQEAVKKAIYAVYKRMTEAYNVLSDPEQRRVYDQSLHRGEARLAPEHRSRRLTSDERKVSNAFARIYLRSAKAKLEKGDLDGAWVDVELGLSLEEAAPLRDLHVKIVRQMSGR